MHAIIGKLVAAVNDHDLDAMVALFHPDYDSRQPVHPGRVFLGREQVRANWGAMFAGIPDLTAELIRSTEDGELNWCEWAWSGTRSDDEQPFEARGVTLFRIRDDLIVEGTLYMEDLERDVIGIEDAVERLSGARPARSDPGA
jgi:ketosteroid isomerase-like protein